MATVKKTMKKSAPKKAMVKKSMPKAMPSMGGGMMKAGGKMKKAQTGMTMKQLKSKYPDVDTTAKGDVRGSEMSSGAPKKVLQKYNDTYNAFERKYKGGSSDVKSSPAKIKKSQYGSSLPKPKPSMKMGGKMSKKK